MARILVAEPAPEVRELVRHVIVRLGHEPVVFPNGSQDDLSDVDAAVLEPAFSAALAAVLSLRTRNPGLPVVCASIYPRTPDVSALRPVAFMLKPFHLEELDDALRRAVELATRAKEP